MATEAAEGMAALDKGDYSSAVMQLTAALKTSQSPVWLSQRSTAYQRLGQHDLALIDADNAVAEAFNRGRSQQIATAQFRRAVALHGLKRYGDSKLCLAWCQKYYDKEKENAIDRLQSIWEARVASDYDKAGGETAEQNKCTVKEIPDKIDDVAADSTPKVVDLKGKGKMIDTSTPIPITTTTTQAPTPKEKIRYEFYQSIDKVTITIFAKGVPKDKASVAIEEGRLDFNFPLAESNSTYDLTFDPLFSRIDPTKSSFRITPHKVEILLHKATPGLKWPSLEGTEPTASSTSDVPRFDSPAEVKAAKAPSYPTSSRTGPKDWDKLASSALHVGAKNGKEVDEDEEDADPMEGFFKKLYKDADPDTRRAMIKSYQESNGTALSTNWDEVSKATVKTHPPDGVEAKKWGE